MIRAGGWAIILAACSAAFLTLAFAPDGPHGAVPPDSPSGRLEASWKRVATPPGAYWMGFLGDIEVVSASEWWATSASGRFLHYNGTFSVVEPDLWYRSPTDIDMVSPEEGWAVGESGSVLHYAHGNWTSQIAVRRAPRDLFAVSMLDSTFGWAAGDGIMLRYENGTWHLETLPDYAYILDIQTLSVDDAWAVGGHGTILHYANGSWATVSSPTTRGLSALDMLNATDGWAVGDGTILHYTRGAWELASSPTADGFQDIDMVSPEEGWIVGDSAVLHYLSGTWTFQPVPSTDCPGGTFLNSLAMVSALDGWAVGYCTSIFHLTAGPALPAPPVPLYLPMVGQRYTDTALHRHLAP